MNLGNTNNKLPDNKPSESGIDKLVESLNNKIAFLLGKRNRQPNFNAKTSNSTFFIIISSCALLLWLSTGFYYIAENQFGIILHYGRAAMVKRGVAVGFTLPYPLSTIEILDSKISKLISFKDNSKHEKLVLLTSDLHPINIDGNFSYQINNPMRLYKNYLQRQQSLDEVILWNLQNSLHNLVSKLDRSSLSTMSLVDVQNMLTVVVNQRLSSYGVRVVKVNVLAVNQIDKLKPISVVALPGTASSSMPMKVSESQTLPSQILEQVHGYKTVVVQTAMDNANKFNQLLVKYKQNPQQTVQEMYNDALSQIPIQEPNYSLLNLSLDQLLVVDKHLKTNSSTNLNRNNPAVLRERDYGGRGRSGREDVTGGIPE